MNCEICQKPSAFVCSGCRAVAYCGLEHQKRHWKEHKSNCRSFVVKKNKLYGRYIVAARDISQGTVIMDELPIVVGPKQDTIPICLGCNRKISPVPKTIYYCSNCKTVPLCGQSCELLPIHAENECKVYSKNRAPFKILSVEEKHSAYESILTLRCLLLKKNDPKKWQQLTSMQAQNENRATLSPEVWHRNQVNTVDLLRNHFGMETEFSEAEIHSVIGYSDINAFEIKSKSIEICGLYDNVYLMVHDCVCNTHHSIDDDFRMVVRATVPVKKGQLISTIYTQTLEGTLERRKNLRESKYFDCHCERCSDPTELGTYFSAIKCKKCELGYHLPVNSLNPESPWICTHCPTELSIHDVSSLLTTLKVQVDKIVSKAKLDYSIPPMEEFISQHSGVTLHPNHFLLISFVYSLCQVYGRVKGWFIDDLTYEALERKKEHCLHILKIMDAFDPGMSRIRGVTLYELHAAIFFSAKLEFQAEKISVEQLKDRLVQVLSLLKQSKDILSFDPRNSVEGVIANSIPGSIDGVNTVISHFCG